MSAVPDGLEEILDAFSGHGRLSSYARDLTRLVAWVRTQPRSRLLLLDGLGAGVLAELILLSARRRPEAPGNAPWAMLPEAEPEGEQGPQ